jgi:hypothetical protein
VGFGCFANHGAQRSFNDGRSGAIPGGLESDLLGGGRGRRNPASVNTVLRHCGLGSVQCSEAEHAGLLLPPIGTIGTRSDLVSLDFWSDPS